MIKDEKDCIIPVSPHEFYRMMYNLIDNAFKYSDENGEIRVSCLIKDKVTITVEDTGAGIDKENAERIFEPFYCINDSRSTDGLGIGLSVVKGVVDDAKITVESELGKGTKICIVLPKK